MKKFLTIMVLALALCLICSVAMAEVKTGNGIQWTGDWLDPDDHTVVIGDTDVTVTNATDKITIEGVKYDKVGGIGGANLSASEGGPWASSVKFPITKENCARVLTVYVKYTDGGDDKVKGINFVGFGHYWDLVDVDKAATCTEAGSGTYKCAYCGATKTDVIGKKGHNYVETVIVAPDCSHNGTAIMKCSRCGDTTGSEIVKVGGHQWKIIWVDPECERGVPQATWEVNTGSKAIKCSICGKYSTAATLKLAKEDTTNANVVSYPAITYYPTLADYNAARATEGLGGVTGHDYSVWRYIQPSCVEAGYKIRWCTRCDANQTMSAAEVQLANPTEYANNWPNGHIATGPVWTYSLRDEHLTCNFLFPNDVGNAISIYCSKCGGKEGHIFKGTTTTEVDKAGNTYTLALAYDPNGDFANATFQYIFTVDAGENREMKVQGAHAYVYSDEYILKTIVDGEIVNAEIAPTCTSTGKLQYLCVNSPEWELIANHAGVLGAGSHKMATVKSKDALGHAWGEWVEKFAPIPGVENSGWWFRTCSRCLLTEDNHGNVAPCATHTPTYKTIVAATCSSTGTRQKVCSVCGVELGAVEETAKLAHVFNDAKDWVVKTAPTCDKAGVGIKKCTLCGEMVEDELPKLAHAWDAGVITKEATKDAKGEKTYTCTACGATKTEPVDYVVTAPAEYTLTASYDGATVTGKLEHVDDTLEADVKNIRVTFYVEGNYYMATMAEVAADGTFTVDGVGPIVYITVAATGNTSVNPENYEKIAEPQEIFVK